MFEGVLGKKPEPEALSEKQKKSIVTLVDLMFRSYKYIDKAKDQGFFIESIARIDALMNFELKLMLSFSCKTEDEERLLKQIEESVGEDNLTKKAHTILCKRGVISERLSKQIEQFRFTRNTMVHGLLGSAIVISKRKPGTIKFEDFNLEKFEKDEKELLGNECEEGKNIMADLLKEFARFYGINPETGKKLNLQ